MADTNIEKVTFMGATVESFSCDFGFNSNPSTATIGLVEDFDNDDLFAVDNFEEVEEEGGGEALEGQLKAATGGNPYVKGNPGTFASFTLPDDTGSPFTFRGIITSWRRTNTSSGRKISVKMEDARLILNKIPIIINSDLLTLAGQGGSINPANHNIIDVFGYHGNVINSDWTKNGISARSVIAAIPSKTVSFYGKAYSINFSASAPSYFIMRIPPNYRVPIADTTVSQFLDKIAKDNNFDWYADVTEGGIITIHAIPRANNGDLIFSDDLDNHPAHQFVSNRKDKLISFEAGRELRKESNDVVVVGDKRRTIYAAEEYIGGTRSIYPIFSQSKDGHLYDKMFIPLDNVHSANDTSVLSGLPYLSSEKKGVLYDKPKILIEEETGYEYVPYTKHTKVRSHDSQTDGGTLSRVGYLATEEILRAALYSKEAWATTVFYHFYDSGAYEFAAYERSDDGVNGKPSPLGRTAGNATGTIQVPLGVAQGMGIFYPDWDRSRASENPIKARIENLGSSFWSDSEAMQAVKEACYQATLKFAQDFYGKVFTLALPYSPLYDGILAGFGSNYSTGEKDILPEYELTDGAPPLFDLLQSIESNLPYNVLNNENRAFTTSKGLIKPWMAINHDLLVAPTNWNAAFPRYGYSSYEELDENKTTKVQDGSGSAPHTEQLTSGFSVVTSDLSV